ncbi:uncharacterized protein F5147DRAFT_647616 [Suillus discolor]|uniref:Uncharacterized protein n=1 Tax=Suillus discolor TaxID=1912936 RepID=A0A9P7K0I6_9AGAM|nr:uncharacterized protein F5147DRAFT_647616 [Suillus discolor]KAG2119721.1 hypothetical protein F5147DRAFT_647616 [Suillus discolor]
MFLYNNYKQVLDILYDGQTVLPCLMWELSVTDETELECQEGIRWDDMDELEMKLGMDKHWQPEDIEWQNTGWLIANRKFQLALDTLEGLIVARIFKLSKMNRAGTGYKMQKHIGKALQVWSAAICTALNCYNLTAHALSPPHPALKWEDIVEYAFLADFELLRDACEDILQCLWATPSGCHAMDLYFKMCRTREEIEHLNVEIRCVATYLQDESTCDSHVRTLIRGANT